MKKVYFLLLTILFAASSIKAQNVTVNPGAGSYPTLKAAFDAINAGTHTGAITVAIGISTVEGTTPATLNSSGAGAASYTSVLIFPSADGISVSGNPVTGFGVIQLKGADNVTIDGDNPNTGGTNRNLTVNNTTTTTVIANSCIRIATAATNVTSADNITIKNCILNGNVTSGNASGITSTTGSSNSSFGIYCGGNGGATATDAPTAITSVTTNTAPSGTTINNLTIDNNTINQCARAIVFNGAVATVAPGTTTITNNLIGDQAGSPSGTPPYTTPATTVYTKGIWLNGLTTGTVTGNTIKNVLSYIGTTITAIETVGAIGGAMNISNNTITNIVNNASSACNGIQLASATTTYTLSGNIITNVRANSSSCSGITSSTTATSATISLNKITTVRSHSTGGVRACGITIAAGNAVTIQNNFIAEVLNIGSASFSTSFNANGILLLGGINHKVYHNTVNLFGVSTSVGSNSINCLAISASSQTGIDVRNNIFSNTVTGGAATDAHTCIFLPFAASASMLLNLNNNAYYTGNIAGKSGIGFGGTTAYAAANVYDVANFIPGATTPATNWRSLSSAFGVIANDNASLGFTAAAPFVSATDLHINVGVTPTQLESGGATVGLLTDIDGQVRPGPAGSVNGGAIAPDLGADEFDGVILDIAPPVISYTPLPFICVTGARTLTAAITDLSGVPTSGPGLPVLYWRINAGAYTAATGSHTGGNNYNFTFGAGAVLGDVVSYYIVAQDNVATPNVGASPAAGAGGFTANPPAAATPPTTPNSYNISSPLSGTYTVGVGGNYTTITNAVNAYNNSCLTGAVIFNLIDATYPSETFPITINQNPDASAVNTLTIKPATGLGVTITGSNVNAIVKLNGADYVTIDGLNTGGSSLFVTNTNAAGLAEFWIGSANATDGALNNTIKNIAFAGLTNSVTVGGIVVGSGTTLGNPAESPNHNLTIEGCSFIRQQNGIYVAGNTTTRDQNTVINQNTFGSTVAADKLTFRGLSVQNVQNFTISNNTIAGVLSTTTSSATVTGISVFGLASGGNIFNNKISDIKQANTTGWGSNGIGLFSTSTAIGLNVYNNFVSDVASQGFNGVTSSDNGYGIMVGSGTGYNIYFNTVHLNTNQGAGAASGITAAINLASGLAAGAVNLRNNILGSSQTIGANRYAILSSSANTAFSAIDYNDYYTTGPNLGFIGVDRVNLAAIVAGFGGNTNSINVTPVYVSATDLHLDPTTNCLLNGKATPIATITTDIDGNTRNALTPDLGADEFTSATEPTITLGANPVVCVGTTTANLTYSAVTNTPDQYSIDFDAAAEAQGFVDVVNAALPASPIVITITGAVPGTYNALLRIRNSTTGCLSNNYPITVTINPNNTIALTSAPGTNAQTVCINTPIVNITYATTTATGATFSGLPAGVTGNWAANVVTISGTPTTTVGSPFSYTVTLTGGGSCGTLTANGTITVIPNNTVTLTSAPGTNAQSVCINTPITNITYSTTGATGATFSGLPAGVTGNWAANVVTISGTPTTTVGSPFSYTVTLTGGCGSITATGTITVNPDNSITLTSAPGTDAQTVCVNTAITNITYATTTATGATFSGLPAGVTGNWAANVVTISGTPTTAVGSPFSYTVTLTGGGTCGTLTATGTITVTPNNTITLTSAAGTNAQTVCMNSPIANITYSTTGATGASFSGLPAGVTGAWVANVVTISGTPTTTVGSPFNYTVTLTGGCGVITANGTITVNPLPVINSTQVEPSTCASADGSINITVSGAAGPYTFAWTGPGVNPTSEDQINLTVGNYSVTVTAANGCTATANFALAGPGGCSICPTIPTFVTSPTGAACAGSNVTFTASGLTDMGTTYGIIFKYSVAALPNPYVGGTVIATVANGALTAGQTVATANSAIIPVGSYFVYAILTPTPVDLLCRPAVQINLTIGATPDVNQPANQVVCNAFPTAAVNFSGSVPGTVFNWTNNTPSIGLAASGTGNIASFTATNVTNAPVVATITVTPAYTTGSGGGPVTQTFSYTGAVQTFTVPAGVTSIDIDTRGAQGGGNGGGGRGARMNATYSVTPGQVLNIVVGQQGLLQAGGNAQNSSGGGGGSFVYTSAGPTLLVAAGGGGGKCNYSGSIPLNASSDGQITVNGANATSASYGVSGTGGTGGNGGNGGAIPGPDFDSGGGTGWLSAGTSASTGGKNAPSWAGGNPFCGGGGGGCGGFGGFGGGGGGGNDYGGGGGGGGYSGGGGGADPAHGGGGGSFSSGTAQANAAGFQLGDGQVIISYAATSITCTGTPKTFTITVNPTPAATISYTGSPYCSNAGTATVTHTGTAGGTYSAAPAGLTINAANGDVTLGTSTPGTYTVTYTIAAAGGCAIFTTTTSITITALPVATINYAGSPYCSNAGTATVTQTGTTGGTYTAAPAGLTINAATGAVTLATSAAGTYTVSYTIAAAGGCPAVIATATISISAANAATISYAGSPYCSTVTSAPVTRTGTAGGTYSASPAGLTINAATGTVNPSTSTPGTYTVSYTMAANGPCPALTVTTSITITAAPNMIIFYAGTPYCSNAGTANVTRFGTAGGTYSAAPAGLTINAATGAVTLGTSTPGTYTVTYSVTAAGCGITITTTTITITAAPNATIAYAGSPYCSNAGTANVTLTGSPAGGTYSSTAGLSINAATGAVNLAASTAGTYTVTYTVAASGGCATYTTTATITITTLPAATIAYTGSPYCSNAGTATVTRTGTAGGTYTAAPAGLSINAATGAVNLAASTAGTYTVTYTIAAGGGCPAVTATTALR